MLYMHRGFRPSFFTPILMGKLQSVLVGVVRPVLGLFSLFVLALGEHFYVESQLWGKLFGGDCFIKFQQKVIRLFSAVHHLIFYFINKNTHI